MTWDCAVTQDYSGQQLQPTVLRSSHTGLPSLCQSVHEMASSFLNQETIPGVHLVHEMNTFNVNIGLNEYC